jgi:lysophospholipid acyltransferase (LPLAT)-like uncharacterized protein
MQHLDDHVSTEDAIVTTPDAGHAPRRELLDELVALSQKTGQTGADLRHAHVDSSGTPGFLRSLTLEV